MRIASEMFTLHSLVFVTIVPASPFGGRKKEACYENTV
jgi:hypothetical protein